MVKFYRIYGYWQTIIPNNRPSLVSRAGDTDIGESNDRVDGQGQYLFEL